MTELTTTEPTPSGTAADATPEWKQSACILCECNCGIEIRLGGEDGRRFERIRGDKAHPASKGYTCEKALRLDHYQNGRADRVLHPLRRRDDGTFEEVDWDTAIAEVAGRLGAIRDAYGGEKIMYYGGGGQGNHLPGAYGSATLRAFGARYRSSALAQEKTGEFWVSGKMLGTFTRSDFEHAEVAMFVGKNPWMSHSIPHARTTLKEIARDPGRALIVIDPRRTETAALADIHLQVKPGRDAWLIGAMAAIVLDERLADRAWLADHANDLDDVSGALAAIPIAEWCSISGVDEALVRTAVRRIAAADSVAVFEDLGVQMNRHSTLVSYLERLVWMLTGNFGKPGTQYSPSSLVPLARTSSGSNGGGERAHPGHRVADHLGPDALQRDPGRDPHRSSRPVPSPRGGERQSRPLARRLEADAGSDRGARVRRGDRCGDDRDGPARRLRAPGDHPVREVRGDVLQLRVPAQRLPPPPPGAHAA